MSTEVRVATARAIYGARVGAFNKVEIRSPGHVIADGHEIDLRTLPSTYNYGSQGYIQGRINSGDFTPDKGTAVVSMNRYSNGNFKVLCANIIPADQSETNVITTYTDEQLPVYPVWPQGEPQAPQTIVATGGGSFTYSRLQDLAIAAIRKWRKQKQDWMLDAAKYEDIAGGRNDTLIDKVGQWLKSADAAIKYAFQSSSIPPQDVADIATLAILGAADITSVEQYMQSVYYHGTPPTVPMLWVSKNNPQRLNVSSVEQYGNLNIIDYNSLDSSWIIGNQVGTLTLSSTDPTVNKAINATLTDPDGGLHNITYQWQKRTGNQGTWTNISGATNNSYTPVQADVGSQLRCNAAYNDNYNKNINGKNTVESIATSAVIAS